jgi:RHS repeat-associated protein
LSSPNVISQPMTALAHTSESDCRTRTTSEHYTANESWTRTKYTYDALDRRVSKDSNVQTECDTSGTVFYVYDIGNHSGPVVATETGVNHCKDEIFAGSRHLATYQGLAVFTHSDWLGTERLRTWTGWSGLLPETCTSLPFGDNLTCLRAGGPAGDPGGVASPLHFTGKERDAESGLDNFGARYDSSQFGRFMSPDPLLNSGRPSNPQTWNRYAYALNNPLNIIDPFGLYNLDNTCATDDKKCNKQFQQDAKNLKQGVSDLQKKVDNMKDGPEKTRLEASLKALGTENDGNNVNVKFGALSGSAAGNTDTVYNDKTGGLSFNVTFDPSKISGGTNSWAIDAAHEGTHVADISDPRYANDATTLSPFQLEYRGYQTSGWAAQALGVSSLSFGSNVIWNSSWGAVDRQTLMDRGITQHVTSIPGHPEPQPPIPHNPWPN